MSKLSPTLLALFICLQVALCLYLLLEKQGPQRFGWQMYSRKVQYQHYSALKNESSAPLLHKERFYRGEVHPAELNLNCLCQKYHRDINYYSFASKPPKKQQLACNTSEAD